MAAESSSLPSSRRVLILLFQAQQPLSTSAQHRASMSEFHSVVIYDHFFLPIDYLFHRLKRLTVLYVCGIDSQQRTKPHSVWTWEWTRVMSQSSVLVTASLFSLPPSSISPSSSPCSCASASFVIYMFARSPLMTKPTERILHWLTTIHEVYTIVHVYVGRVCASIPATRDRRKNIMPLFIFICGTFSVVFSTLFFFFRSIVLFSFCSSRIDLISLWHYFSFIVAFVCCALCVNDGTCTLYWFLSVPLLMAYGSNGNLRLHLILSARFLMPVSFRLCFFLLATLFIRVRV